MSRPETSSHGNPDPMTRATFHVAVGLFIVFIVSLGTAFATTIENETKAGERDEAQTRTPPTQNECDSRYLAQYEKIAELNETLAQMTVEPGYMKEIARNAGTRAARAAARKTTRRMESDRRISYTAERIASLQATLGFLEQHPLEVEETPSPEALKWADRVYGPREGEMENLMDAYAHYQRTLHIEEIATSVYDEHAAELNECTEMETETSSG